ncbi:hypothetical protein [Sinorhizobium medicae]|uniref:hypothetical protein n=1 Tax=Sinorhizobium medicae TaxID=110321 RepID=UPI0011B63C1E|nr:hypothetical protein [Sinorhizobium medicae]PLU41293.1 hypothetical protein BMJ28_08995 [Sinorhizobium medicae]
MANEATNDTTNTRGHVSKMQSGLELLAQIKLRPNGSVEEFLTDIRPVLRAFTKKDNEFKYKTPVNKINNECYRFAIGRLGQGVVKSPSEGADILDKLISAALDDSDTEFRASIEEAYQLDPTATEGTSRLGKRKTRSTTPKPSRATNDDGRVGKPPTDSGHATNDDGQVDEPPTDPSHATNDDGQVEEPPTDPGSWMETS